MVRPGKQIATIPLDNPPEEVLPPSYEDIQNAANAIASSTANATGKTEPVLTTVIDQS